MGKQTQGSVTAMYMDYPIPNNSVENIMTSVKDKMRNYFYTLNMDPDTFFQGKKVLDAGCGTGDQTCVFASLGAKKAVGIDLSKTSLKIAHQRKKHFGLDNLHFDSGSVLELPYDDATFDVVYSTGVIHHTPDTYKAFTELVRVLKPGGTLILFVYNRANHIMIDIERAILTFFCGQDLDKKFHLAKRLFPWMCKKVMHYDDNATNNEYNKRDATIYDKFCVPIANSYSIKHIMNKWFEPNGIQYAGSCMPVEFKRFGQYASWKGKENYDSLGRGAKIIARFFGVLFSPISFSDKPYPMKKPGFFSRLFTETYYFFRGFVSYSCAPTFCGIKKKDSDKS